MMNKHFSFCGRLVFGVCGGLLWLQTAFAEDINPRTLCPKSGAIAQTILIIDTTDVLTPVAQARLEELLKSFYDPDTAQYIKRGEELIFYRIAASAAELGKPISVCSPGNPSNRTWKDNLLSGKYDQLRRWRRFLAHIKRALPEPEQQKDADTSPLLESIAVIAARHIPVTGARKNRKPTRLILFSDMLQHSANLSHYKTVPSAREFKKLRGYGEMDAKLPDVKVRLFYIRRSALEDKQTTEHYYWWTQYIESAGGIVVEQRLL